jgi:hypothetical protein
MGPFSEITARRTHVRFSPMIGGRRPDKDHRRALRRVASAIAAMRASLGKFGVVVWNQGPLERGLGRDDGPFSFSCPGRKPPGRSPGLGRAHRRARRTAGNMV